MMAARSARPGAAAPSAAPVPGPADWQRSPWRLPALGGFVCAQGYFPWGLLLPNLLGFLPMLHWLDANPRARARERLRAGFAFALALYGTILHWVFAMVWVSWLAIAMYALLAALFSVCAAVSLAWLGWLRRRTGWSFGLLLPATWLPFEWLRTWGDLRMTADHVAHSLARYPFLVQCADVVGPYGVGAFMLAVNGLAYEVWRRRKDRSWRTPACALAWVLGSVLAYAGWAWTHPPQSQGQLRVALVQPNVPLLTKLDPATNAEQWAVLVRTTRQAALERPDVIVWPETAYPGVLRHWLDRPETYRLPEVEALAREIGVPILAGVEYARVRGTRDYDLYNAAVVVTPEEGLAPVWTAKVYLVPFTEKVPFEPVLGRWLGGKEGERLRWLAGGFTPPPAPVVLSAAGSRVGVLVCYEELYWDLARRLRREGAQFQAVITNDAWFGRTVFQPYLAHALRLRAIENRTAIVRVANTGISGFVDPLGRYEGWTPLFQEAVVVREVPLTDHLTVYDRTGDLVAWLAIVLLGVASIASSRRGEEGA